MGAPICFTAVQVSSGRKKRAPVAVGAGGRLDLNSCAISIHATVEVQAGGNALLVQAMPSQTPGSFEETLVLDQLVGGSDTVKLHAKEWAQRVGQWGLEGALNVGSSTPEAVSDAVHGDDECGRI